MRGSTWCTKIGRPKLWKSVVLISLLLSSLLCGPSLNEPSTLSHTFCPGAGPSPAQKPFLLLYTNSCLPEESSTGLISFITQTSQSLMNLFYFSVALFLALITHFINCHLEKSTSSLRGLSQLWISRTLGQAEASWMFPEEWVPSHVDLGMGSCPSDLLKRDETWLENKKAHIYLITDWKLW